MPSLPDWAYLPRLQELAVYLRCPVDELRAVLLNQGIYAGPDDRVDPKRIFGALQAEIDAGRPFPVFLLESAKH